MKPSCHICHGPSAFLLNKDDFDLYKCRECSLVFVYPQPSLDFLRKEIYSEKSGFQANRVEDISKVPPNRRYKAMYKLIGKVLPKAQILDVGAGGGHFLYWANKYGFSGAGVELNRRTASSARAHGLTIFNGTLTEAVEEIGSRKFDVVTLGEIIEHVNSPRELINSSKKVLKEDGFILVTTPNLDCFWSRSTFLLYKWFKVPWSSVTPPYHLFQFDSDNLDLLLNQEGFTLTEEVYIPMTKLKYELGMLHLLKRLKRTKKVSDFLLTSFAYSSYTILFLANFALRLFLKKDFNMVKLYRKI